jgi:hypothetical protein
MAIGVTQYDISIFMKYHIHSQKIKHVRNHLHVIAPSFPELNDYLALSSWSMIYVI